MKLFCLGSGFYGAHGAPSMFSNHQPHIVGPNRQMFNTGSVNNGPRRQGAGSDADRNPTRSRLLEDFRNNRFPHLQLTDLTGKKKLIYKIRITFLQQH